MDVVYRLSRLDVSDLDRGSPRIPFERRHPDDLAGNSGRLGRFDIAYRYRSTVYEF